MARRFSQIRFAHHDHAAKVQARSTQRSDGKQSVIDGAERRARDKKSGKLEMRHQINHELRGIDGHERAAGAFGDEILVERQCGEA